MMKGDLQKKSNTWLDLENGKRGPGVGSGGGRLRVQST